MSRNDGPPNIEQIIQNIMKSFQGKSGKGSGNIGNHFNNNVQLPGNSWINIIIAIVVFMAFYFVMGFYSVLESEEAVVTRFGKYNRVEGAGLHWHIFLVEKPHKVDINYIHSLQRDNNTMLTADQNIVTVNTSLQYRYADPKAYLFNALTPVLSLEELMDSATRHVIGHMRLDDILTTEKSQIAPRIKEIIDEALKVYNIGITLSVVTLIEAKPPSEVQYAFDDVIRAKEDYNTFKNEAFRYQEKKIPEANGRAKRITEQADAEREKIILGAQGKVADFLAILPDYKKSPEITSTRLYTDVMREVLSSTSKIVIDSEGNNLMYLPLQDMLTSKPSSSVDEKNNTSSASIQDNQQEYQVSEPKRFYSGKAIEKFNTAR